VDPTDATKRDHINGCSERHWRHLDTCQFETIIKARIPQLKYSDDTVEALTVSWAERHSRVTTLMAGFVIKLLLLGSISGVLKFALRMFGGSHFSICQRRTYPLLMVGWLPVTAFGTKHILSLRILET
jgi:hypothetical protein